MKKLFIILIPIATGILFAAGVFAQSPQKISYQAVIRNSSNALVTSTQVGMQISILQGSATGTVVYTETKTPTTNTNGLVSIEIGGGAGFNTINWSNNIYFIKTETDPMGGTNYTITGTSQLLSVPYALHAKTAESFTGTITETDPVYSHSQAANITSGDIIKLNNISGINTGDQNGSETKIEAGTNVNITGAGTITNPYVVNAVVSMTQAQRDSLTVAEGLIIYNTTSHKPNFYNGTEWMNYDGTVAETPPTLFIGDSYQGGIVAYVFVSGDPGYVAGEMHGLIAAPSDQSTGVKWYNAGNSITGAIATALGTGNDNTNIIVTYQSFGTYAAMLCSDLVLGGYSDWYLPSKDELCKLYLSKTDVGNFDSVYYWSSTEGSTSDVAWCQSFLTGFQGLLKKGLEARVRAIRTF